MNKFIEFYEHISKAEGAEDRLAALSRKLGVEADTDEVVEAMIVFAKEEGFDFAKEEILQFMDRAVNNSELSEDELEMAAGGKGGGCVLIGGAEGGLCFLVGAPTLSHRELDGMCVIVGAFITDSAK